MDKLDLFRAMFNNSQSISSWIDSIPSDVQSVFYDNEMVNILSSEVDMLAKEVFTDEQYQCIDWFLNEWMSDNKLSWMVDDKEYNFKNIDEYIDLLVNLEIFERSELKH